MLRVRIAWGDSVLVYQRAPSLTYNSSLLITITIQVYWLRILWHTVFAENNLLPIGSIEWITGYRVDRYGIRTHEVQNTGALRIAIFDAGGWSGNDAVAADSVDVSEGADSVVFEGLEPGTYGVKLFHDVDGDGELARGNFGIPTEPYGFSNDAPVRFGPPSFGDAAFALPTDGAVHTVTLR